MLVGSKALQNGTLLSAVKSSTCNDIFYFDIFPTALCTVILASEHWRRVYPFLMGTKTWSKTSFNLSLLICFSSTRGSVTVMWKEWSGGRYFGEVLRRFFPSVIPSHCHHGFCNSQHCGEVELSGLLCMWSASTTLTFTENIESWEKCLSMPVKCLFSVFFQSEFTFKREFSISERFIVTTVNIGSHDRSHGFPRPLEISCPYRTSMPTSQVKSRLAIIPNGCLDTQRP